MKNITEYIFEANNKYVIAQLSDNGSDYATCTKDELCSSTYWETRFNNWGDEISDPQKTANKVKQLIQKSGGFMLDFDKTYIFIMPDNCCFDTNDCDKNK